MMIKFKTKKNFKIKNSLLGLIKERNKNNRVIKVSKNLKIKYFKSALSLKIS
jgi:hypothetical protein